jgi:hypothetical protein
MQSAALRRFNAPSVSEVEFDVTLRDGGSYSFPAWVSQSVLATLLNNSESGRATEIVVDLLRVPAGRWVEAWEIDHWGCTTEPAPREDVGETADRRAAAARSCSLLAFAHRALPAEVREETLEEWVDEIQTAADLGLPVRRRALSILLRSLPVLALRARLPARVRGGGS